MDKYNNIVLASMISKIIGNTVFYPFDLVRTNQRNSNKPLKIWPTMKQIYYGYYEKQGTKRGNIMRLYNGALLYNCVSTPNFVLMMFFREQIKKYLDTTEHDENDEEF